MIVQLLARKGWRNPYLPGFPLNPFRRQAHENPSFPATGVRFAIKPLKRMSDFQSNLRPLFSADSDETT
jgi:hypothetical protein